MSNSIECPSCRRHLKVSETRAGKQIICPACRRAMIVPVLKEALEDAELAGSPPPIMGTPLPNDLDILEVLDNPPIPANSQRKSDKTSRPKDERRGRPYEGSHQENRRGSRIRWLIVAIFVLAFSLIGFGIWHVYQDERVRGQALQQREYTFNLVDDEKEAARLREINLTREKVKQVFEQQVSSIENKLRASEDRLVIAIKKAIISGQDAKRAAAARAQPINVPSFDSTTTAGRVAEANFDIMQPALEAQERARVKKEAAEAANVFAKDRLAVEYIKLEIDQLKVAKIRLLQQAQ